MDGSYYFPNLHVDMVIGSFIKPETLAIYFAAVRIASLLALPIMAINQLVPLISEYFHSNKLTKLKSLLKVYSAFISLLMIPTFILCIFWQKTLIYYLVKVMPPIAYSLCFLLHISFVHLLVRIFTNVRKFKICFKRFTNNTVIVNNTSVCLCRIYGVYAIAIIKILEIGSRNLIHVFNGYKLSK